MDPTTRPIKFILITILLACLLLKGKTVTAGGNLGDCSGPFDVVLLIDSSVSLRDYDPFDRPLQTWKMMTSFASTFVDNLPTDKNINVAVVRYSSTSQIVLQLTSRQGYSSATLSDLTFVGQNTNTAAALSDAKTLLQSSSSQRKIVILMSDGLTTLNTDSTFQKASELKNASVEIYSIGVTGYIDARGLAKIASTPESKYLLQLSGPAQVDNIRDIILRRVCNLPDPTVVAPPKCTTIPNCESCLTDNRICGNCSSGYYREGWNCKPCIPNCVSCANGQGCSTCSVGHYFNPTTGMCEECSTGIFDLAFLVDSSGSIRDKNPKDASGNILYDNYDIILQFVQDIIDSLPIGQDKTRVAMISFSNEAKVYFRLNSLNYDRVTINRAVSLSPYEGSFTNISGALRLLRTDIYQQVNGDRPAVPNVCILITDGESNKDPLQTIPEANMVKALGTKIFAVGATSEINQNELIQVASQPTADHFFYSSDFIGIKDHILQKLSSVLCTST